MMDSKVYLAGPIGGCTDDEATTWREYVKMQIGEESCIDPMRRDFRGVAGDHVDEIVYGDLEDILRSDIVLANCWQRSFGTPMELWEARRVAKKLIVVIHPPDVAISPWLSFVATRMTFDLDEAIAAVRQLDAVAFLRKPQRLRS